MNYLITGGTGLIGQAITKKLLLEGHAVTILTRHKTNAIAKMGDQATFVEDLEAIPDSTPIDAVINLAGEPIADRPWTHKRKRQLEQSRIELTQRLVSWIANRQSKPSCLISGSAVGWYGDGKEAVLTENSGFNADYAHTLCDEWEKAALQASEHHIRVCIVRTGLVLAKHGGFLKRLLLPFKLGLGSKLGKGDQYMPWIHLEDITNLFIFLSQSASNRGVFNGVAPVPVTNAEFTQTLAKVLNRPAFLSTPACFLRTLMGEMSLLLLTGQNAKPEKAQAAGFKFTYTKLEPALFNVIKETE